MTTELFFDFILVLIGAYLALFKSYFSEKGKNLATNEDIEELTRKVESIKIEFAEKDANMRAKLDLLTSLQINHKNDERLALIDYHKKVKQWMNLLMEPSPVLLNEFDNNEIQGKIRYYDKAYQDVLIAEAVLELYVEDVHLIKLAQFLKIEILKSISVNPIRCLIRLKENNSAIESEGIHTTSLYTLERRTEEHKRLLKERGKLYENNRKLVGAARNVIIFSEKKYFSYLKKYLKNISNSKSVS